MQVSNSLLKAIMFGIGVSTLAPSCSLYDDLEENIKERRENSDNLLEFMDPTRPNDPPVQFIVDDYNCPACGMG
jgi:hypothetical protein